MSILGVIRDAATGLTAAVTARGQTPTGNALQVIIGPADPVNNITPVVIDWEHHQLHEGETFYFQDQQLSLGTSTVKYAIVVPSFSTNYNGAHMLLGLDVYNGSCRADFYEGATYTSGSAMTARNRNRNISTSPTTTGYTGVTSANGTLIESFFVGASSRASDSNRSTSEFVLKNSTTYRLDLVGLVANTQAILTLQWYEDLGV